jgi:DNA-binding transcriptional regulator YiaG
MPPVDGRIVDVTVDDELITFWIADGRRLSLPTSWSWRLERATTQQREKVEIQGGGQIAHWPDIDEDLSWKSVVNGSPAPRNEALLNAEPPNPWPADRIRSLRTRLSVTQTDFADLMGVRTATISEWENGHREPSPMARRLLDRINASTKIFGTNGG